MTRRGSGLRHSSFGTSGSGTIVIGAAEAPMGNCSVTSEVGSLLVLVTSVAVTVVPTVTGDLPLEFSPSLSKIEG